MQIQTIIGLTGPACSGKDTVADLLVAHAGFTKIAFADTLRTEIALAYAIDLSFLTQRETKEMPMRCLALSRCLDKGFITRIRIMHKLKDEPLNLDTPRSPRQIMQWWGTDYRRHQRGDYWVSVTHSRISDLLSQRIARRIVVTDIRFFDEADLVRRNLSGQIWQIERDGIDIAKGSHISETTGSAFRPDVVINNSHSIGHLQARVLEALEPGSPRVRVAA